MLHDIFNKRTLHVPLVLLIAIAVFFSQWQLSAMKSIMGVTGTSSGGIINEVYAATIPSGVPDMPYGTELGVSFDTAAQSMAVMESYDRGTNMITLEGDALDRYIRIAMQTACQYCCSATTLVFQDGQAACGCAHSAAMRGLIAYLITNHGGELSDEEILTEANRWKAIFFPKQTLTKALQAQASSGAIDPSIINDMPDMVGGC